MPAGGDRPPVDDRSLTSMRLAVSTVVVRMFCWRSGFREPLPPSPRPHPYRPSEGEGGRGEAPFVEPELRLAGRSSRSEVWRTQFASGAAKARRSSIYSGSLSSPEQASPGSFIQRTSPFKLSGLGCSPLKTGPATVKEALLVPSASRPKLR